MRVNTLKKTANFRSWLHVTMDTLLHTTKKSLADLAAHKLWTQAQ